MTSVPTSGGDEAPSERQDFALAIDDAPVRYVFAGDGGFTRVAVPRAGEGRKSRRYLRGLPWLRRITRGGDGPAPDLVHYWNISYLPLEQIRESWQLFVPVAERPTSPQTEREWQNFVGVILRASTDILK